MKLYLVRHGESEGNVKHGFISGRTDPAHLTTKGKSQIVRTAWELQDTEIDRLYVSPVVRAQETAAILNSVIKAPLDTVEWLTELDHGIFEGYYWWEMIHKIPPSWREKREDYRTPYPEGESMEMLIYRVWKGLHELIESVNNDSSILLVSHQAVITGIRYCLQYGDPHALQTASDIDTFLEYMHNKKLPNGGFVEISIEGGKAQEIQEVSDCKPVTSDQESLRFYLESVLDFKAEPTLEKYETASAHAVYKVISTEKNYLVKVMEGHDVKILKRQIQLYEYLSTKNVPAPKIVHYDDSCSFYSQDILAQDYVEGEVSKECYINHPEKTIHLMQDVFETIKKVHELPGDEVKNFWIPPSDKQFIPWKPFMHYNINLTLHFLQDNLINADVSQELMDVIKDLKDYILKGTYDIVPIHSDLSTGNIISYHHEGECRLKRIIDFEWARMGDKLWDYAYFWGWLEREDETSARIWKEVLEKNFAEDLPRLNQFRLLFHAWTVRDAIDYKGNPIRERRAKKSRDLLQCKK